MGASKGNYENIVITTEAGLVAEYQNHFTHLWTVRTAVATPASNLLAPASEPPGHCGLSGAIALRGHPRSDACTMGRNERSCTRPVLPLHVQTRGRLYTRLSDGNTEKRKARTQ